MNKTAHLVALFVVTLMSVAAVAGHSAVDLKWLPAYQAIYKGEEATVGLYAHSDSSAVAKVSCIEAIIEYDSELLSFFDLINTGHAYDWFISGFLTPSPDGLNVALDDGSMFYSAWAQLGLPAAVTKKGLCVSEFEFIGLQVTSRACVTIPATFGSKAKTSVYDGTVPNTPITGALGSACIMVVPEGYYKSVASVKPFADGTAVDIGGPLVTRTFDGQFYIEDYDRTAGIRVDCADTMVPAEGTNPLVTGVLQTIDGERVLVASSVIDGACIGDIAPLAMTTKSIIATGLNPQGLLVKLSGRIESVSEDDQTFVVEDGSGFPVRVKLYGVDLPTGEISVSVTGALGADAEGPVIRVNRAEDIQDESP